MDTDDVELSEHALKALREFYIERERSLEQEHCSFIEEDWEISQFWYDKNTASSLAHASQNLVGDYGKIACVSCPSVFLELHNMTQSDKHYLFEYDKRFATKFTNFRYYDYNDPLKLEEIFKNNFDLVVADPPYLSEECLSKYKETIKFLTQKKIILCTGAVMEDAVKRFLSLSVCHFKPQHERKLGNEFLCFANFNLDEYIQENPM